MTTTRETIEAAFRGDVELEAARPAVDEALGLLDRGEARLAEPGPEGWTVNGWLQEAILLHFRLARMAVIELLEGAPRAACEQRLIERTRQYAKRQQTWLKRLTDVRLVDGTLDVSEAAAQIEVLLAAERARSPLPSAP